MAIHEQLTQVIAAETITDNMARAAGMAAVHAAAKAPEAPAYYNTEALGGPFIPEATVSGGSQTSGGAVSNGSGGGRPTGGQRPTGGK